MIGTIILSGVAAVGVYLAHHYYHLAHEIREAGAIEALAHFKLKSELMELSRTSLASDELEGYGLDPAYIDGYFTGFDNMKGAINKVLERNLKRLDEAHAVVTAKVGQ